MNLLSFFHFRKMAEEDVHFLFEPTWLGIVENCLTPLTPTQVRRGLQLMMIIPQDGTITSYESRFRNAVYSQFHQYATGRELILNVTGDKTSIQLTYAVDLNTIITAASRMNFRELFAVNLARAGYAHRDIGALESQREAEALVVAIGV
jgi:hypothetical protein